MKKIVSLLIAFLICIALFVPAFAVNMLSVSSGEEKYVEGTELATNLTVYSDGKLIIQDHSQLILYPLGFDNIGTVEINGSLSGCINNFNNSGKFVFGINGWLDLTLTERCASVKKNVLISAIENAGITPNVEEKDGRVHITAGKKPVDDKEHMYVCLNCGEFLSSGDREENSFTASNFGGGSTTIILCATGLVVGFISAMIIFRKKEVK